MKLESLVGVTLELIETVALPGAFPSDARVGRFFRERRFLGSRDRRFVGDTTYAWLRHHLAARHAWRRAIPDSANLPSDEAIRSLEDDLHLSAAPDETERDAETRHKNDRAALRPIYLLDLLALGVRGLLPETYENVRAAATRLESQAIEPESRDRILELTAASSFADGARLTTYADDRERLTAEASVPTWLADRMIDELGRAEALRVAKAFLEPAPVDLRVNLQKKSRDHVREHLERETGKTVETTPHSPSGLRLRDRINLTATAASRHSWVEIQEEGSQIAALACDAKLGHTVIDACAGGGGKSLALIDILFRYQRKIPRSVDEGRVIACDIQKDKLLEFKRRAKEAGLESRAHIVHMYPAGPLPDALPMADLVLVDAPCSGLGTLRRNPELKLRHRPTDIGEFAAQQLSILERFAPLVKEQCVLVYVTCSFLEEECSDVADAFEARHPEFRRHESLWAKKNLPASALRDQRIYLDPVHTGTDAFFIACWERVGREGLRGD